MISKTGQHALNALAVLAELPAGTFMGTGDLAKRIDSPQNYLGKLLQNLSKWGLVTSQKGKGGGFCLKRNPARTTLFDILKLTDQLDRWNFCFMKQRPCSRNNVCGAHKSWKKTKENYLSFLQNTTILNLVAGQPEPKRK